MKKCKFCSKKAVAFVSSKSVVGWLCAKHYVEKVDLDCILAIPRDGLPEEIKKEVEKKYGIRL